MDNATPPLNRSAGTALVLLAGVIVLALLAFAPWSMNTSFESDSILKPFHYILATICFAIPLFFSSWRVLGLAAYALSILLIDLIFTVFSDYHSNHSWLAMAAFSIVIGASLQNLALHFKAALPHARFRIPQLDVAIGAALLVIATLLIDPLRRDGQRSLHREFYWILLVALTLFAWVRLIRHAYELWVSLCMRILYRVRSPGPGLSAIPMSGPVLVIANHACWWDPLFVAGELPRPITPMMTAGFYDIWHLKPFMKHVIKAIRVPDNPIKHQTPEIEAAIAALARGECVVIFPEGYLRRKEELPLRRFGRGVAEILKARPDTPIVAAWIEGGWGSWCSWKDGPPTKNKPFDVRRTIRIGFSKPITLPAEARENHWLTRAFLMNAVSAARTHVGLDPLPDFGVPARENADESTP